MHPEPSIEPSIETESPLFLTEEAPPQDLLGDVIAGNDVSTDVRGSLIDYVSERWKQMTAAYPRIPNIRVMSETRKKTIARRAAEVVRASKGDLDAYQVWDLIFKAIQGNEWLRGDGGAGRNHSDPFAVDIDRVLRTSGNPNFFSILDKAISNDQDARITSDPRTGRQLGPTEQSAYAALALLRAADERRQRG